MASDKKILVFKEIFSFSVIFVIAFSRLEVEVRYYFLGIARAGILRGRPGIGRC